MQKKQFSQNKKSNLLNNIVPMFYLLIESPFFRSKKWTQFPISVPRIGPNVLFLVARIGLIAIILEPTTIRTFKFFLLFHPFRFSNVQFWLCNTWTYCTIWQNPFKYNTNFIYFGEMLLFWHNVFKIFFEHELQTE